MYLLFMYSFTASWLNEHVLKGQLFGFLSLITEQIVFHCDMNSQRHNKIKSQHRKESAEVYYISMLFRRGPFSLFDLFLFRHFRSSIEIETVFTVKNIKRNVLTSF